MLSNLEKFSSLTKSLFESQVASLNVLASKAVANGEKAVALNLAAAKAYSEESGAVGKQFLAVTDPQAFLALVTAQAKQHAEKAAAYGRQVTELVSDVKADLTQAAEAHIADSKAKVAALVDEVIKSAPAGSENAVAMLKTAIGNANAGYEQLSKSTKQAVETVEAHVVSATDKLSQAAKKAA